MTDEFVIFEGKNIKVHDDLLSLNEYGINDIRDVEGLTTLKRVKFLDLSNNNITEIAGLEELVNLEMLFLAYNKISNISGLDSLTKLKDLILSFNQIKDIKNLGFLSNLEELVLLDNNITKISNLQDLANLKRLRLHVNKISEISDLEPLKKLEELNLSYNNIQEIKCLNSQKNLKSLFLASNHITEIKNLGELTNLKFLDLGENKISEIKNIESIGNITNLEILNLNKNPLIGYEEYIIRSGGGPRRILEYSLRKKRGEVGYLEFYNKEIGYDENIELFKTTIKGLKDSDFIEIGTHREYSKYKTLQNSVFFEENPEIIELASENNELEEIIIHLIQLHSLKGISPPHKDGKFDKMEYFNFFIRHFWDLGMINNPSFLIYNSYESRVSYKLDEILNLSIDDYDGKPHLIVFPESTIPYSKIENLKEFSKINNIIIIGGLEHQINDNSPKYINQTIIIDNGKVNYQIKQTPVRIYHSNKIDYTEENISCENFPKIKIFTTTIGRIAIFICKDFLRLCEIIPYWAYKHKIDFVIIPSLTGKVLPFHSKVLNLLNYSDYKRLKFLFDNVGEYGGSEYFSIHELPRIEEAYRNNTRSNLGEVIVKFQCLIREFVYNIKSVSGINIEKIESVMGVPINRIKSISGVDIKKGKKI